MMQFSFTRFFHLPPTRNPIHYLAGIISALAGLQDASYTLACVIVFLVYEIAQDWRKKDWSFYDILEFAIAFFATITGIIIWSFFGC